MGLFGKKSPEQVAIEVAARLPAETNGLTAEIIGGLGQKSKILKTQMVHYMETSRALRPTKPELARSFRQSAQDVQASLDAGPLDDKKTARNLRVEETKLAIHHVRLQRRLGLG